MSVPDIELVEAATRLSVIVGEALDNRRLRGWHKLLGELDERLGYVIGEKAVPANLDERTTAEKISDSRRRPVRCEDCGKVVETSTKGLCKNCYSKRHYRASKKPCPGGCGKLISKRSKNCAKCAPGNGRGREADSGPCGRCGLVVRRRSKGLCRPCYGIEYRRLTGVVGAPKVRCIVNDCPNLVNVTTPSGLCRRCAALRRASSKVGENGLPDPESRAALAVAVVAERREAGVRPDGLVGDDEKVIAETKQCLEPGCEKVARIAGRCDKCRNRYEYRRRGWTGRRVPVGDGPRRASMAPANPLGGGPPSEGGALL